MDGEQRSESKWSEALPWGETLSAPNARSKQPGMTLRSRRIRERPRLALARHVLPARPALGDRTPHPPPLPCAPHFRVAPLQPCLAPGPALLAKLLALSDPSQVTPLKCCPSLWAPPLRPGLPAFFLPAVAPPRPAPRPRGVLFGGRKSDLEPGQGWWPLRSLLLQAGSPSPYFPPHPRAPAPGLSMDPGTERWQVRQGQTNGRGHSRVPSKSPGLARVAWTRASDGSPPPRWPFTHSPAPAPSGRT